MRVCWIEILVFLPSLLGVAQDASRLPSSVAQGCSKSCKAWCARSSKGRGVATAGWLLSEPRHDGNLPSTDNQGWWSETAQDFHEQCNDLITFTEISMKLLSLISLFTFLSLLHRIVPVIRWSSETLTAPSLLTTTSKRQVGWGRMHCTRSARHMQSMMRKLGIARGSPS